MIKKEKFVYCLIKNGYSKNDNKKQMFRKLKTKKKKTIFEKIIKKKQKLESYIIITK